MSSQLALLLLFVLSVSAVEQQWSEWKETPNSPCSDICGYCGVRVIAERTCPILGKCSGVAQRYEECGSKMCTFPRNTCCAGYVKGLPNGSDFECIALATIAAKTKLA